MQVWTSHPGVGLELAKINSPASVPDRCRLRVPPTGSEIWPICSGRSLEYTNLEPIAVKIDQWEIIQRGGKTVIVVRMKFVSTIRGTLFRI
jgi:hypothetical protein